MRFGLNKNGQIPDLIKCRLGTVVNLHLIKSGRVQVEDIYKTCFKWLT